MIDRDDKPQAPSKAVRGDAELGLDEHLIVAKQGETGGKRIKERIS